MKRKTVVGVGLALVLLVLLVAWLTRAPAAELARTDTDERSELPSADPVGASVSTPIEAASQSPEPAAPADERVELVETLTDPVVIAVIDAATKAPVPGALVRTLDDRVSVDGSRDFGQDAFYESRLLAKGTIHTADEHGEVRVERFEYSGRISAEKDSAWGCVQIVFGAAKTPRWTVPIAPDRSLVVRALDEARRPLAGVRVRLRCEGSLGSMNDPTLTAESDASGRAVLRHAWAFYERRRDRPWLAHVVGVLDPPVRVDVDEASFGRELELVLPPVGEVDVKVLTPSGEPELESLLVSLGLADAMLGGSATERSTLARFEGLTSDGSVRVPCVGLGLELHAGSSVPMRVADGRYEARATGPTAAGERVELVLGGPGTAFALVGQLVDEHGAPAQWTQLTCGLDLGFPNGSRTGGMILPNDAEGRFRILLAPAYAERTTRRFRFELTQSDGNVLRGSVEWNADLTAPETDVGVVALHGLTLVVAGRVLDEAGRPALPATVIVYEAGDGPLGPGERGWSFKGDLRGAVKSDGTFEISSDRELGRCGLGISGSPFVLQDVVPFEVGARDVVLRVASTGRVSGHVRFDAGLELSDFTVVIQRTGSTEWELEPVTTTHEPTLGAFHFGAVLAGRYDVRVQLGSDVVLLELADLEVAPGKADDPRLTELDVRGRVREFAFDVLDERHKPLEFGDVHVRTTGTTERWKRQKLQFGRARVVTAGEALDVSLDVVGFRPVVEVDVRASREFVLQRSLDVEVELQGLVLPEGFTARVILNSLEAAPLGYPAGWALGAGTVAQREPLYRLLVPRPGRYSVTVEFLLEGAAGSVPMFDASGEPLEIRDAERQLFRVALDPAVVAETLAYLEKLR